MNLANLTAPDPELDGMSPLAAYLLAALVIVSIAVGAVLAGQQARQDCAAGIDTEASCQGVQR